MDVRHEKRSITDVLVDISRNVQDILHFEIRLAKSEFRDNVVRARPGATLVLVAMGAALLSALFILLAILHMLRLVMPAWASALCLAIALALFSAIAMAAGIRRLRGL
jgi:Putative Actinobacterial Holin-X, holin superfamily III